MIEFDEDKQRMRVARMHAQEEEDLMRALSKKYGIEYRDLTVTPINTDALRLVEEKDAREAEIAPFNLTAKKLDVGVRSPTRKETKVALDDLTNRGYTITPYLVSKRSLESVWARYKDLSFARESTAGALDISDKDLREFVGHVHSVQDARDFITQTLNMKKAQRISRIVEVLLAAAIATHASDIHIEPEETQVRLRLRLDGILTDITNFDTETYQLLLSRVKLLSGLKLNIKKEAQDGRFSISIDTNDIEVRTSVLPGEYGESIVMRVLNPEAIRTPLEELGMSDEMLEVVQREIERPNGMLINTGPTGSGKTTTLYALLTKVHKPGVKIITIEDPVEYHLQGIVQTQVNPKKDYTFANGLRSAVRQDPDIIMVGEIRDSETAEIAIDAALTGHLVFSTLHTNTAAGTFPRLTDLGVSPRVMGSSINLVMAQRLVRRLCRACAQQKPPTEHERGLIESTLRSLPEGTDTSGVDTTAVWHPGEGECSECGGTHYKGRIGVFEIIIVDDAVEEVVRTSPSEREIRKAVEHQEHLTLQQDGILKMLSGVTSFEELDRVLDLTVGTPESEPTPEDSLDEL